MESAEKRHTVTIDGRKRAVVDGVGKVISSSAEEICLVTSRGGLTVRGRELKINSFSEESGILSFDGEVAKIEYDKVKQPFFRRIFK